MSDKERFILKMSDSALHDLGRVPKSIQNTYAKTVTKRLRQDPFPSKDERTI